MLPIVIILSVSSVVVAAINVSCCIVIVYNKKMHVTSHKTVLSLLIGHSIQGLFVIPCYAAKRSGIYKRTAVCDLFRFSYLFTNYACCLSVLAISMDRFIGVQFPLRYKAWVTRRRVTRILLFLWGYVLALCLLPFIPTIDTRCKYNPTQWWVLMMLIGNTLIPFLIIIVCYIVILKKVKSVLVQWSVCSNRLPKLSENSTTQNTTRIQLKRTKMTYFIVAAYILCWGPSFVYNILLHICHDKCFPASYYDSHMEEVVGFVIKLLTFIDGIIAPTIYCCANANFNLMKRRVLSSIRSSLAKSSLYRRNSIRIANISSGDRKGRCETATELVKKSEFRTSTTTDKVSV